MHGKNSQNTINCNVFTFIWTVHCFADTVFHRPTKNRMFLKFELSRLGKACKTKEPIFFYIVRIKMEWEKKASVISKPSAYGFSPILNIRMRRGILMFMFCGFNFFFKYAPNRWHISFFNMCYDIFFLTFLMM